MATEEVKTCQSSLGKGWGLAGKTGCFWSSWKFGPGDLNGRRAGTPLFSSSGIHAGMHRPQVLGQPRAPACRSRWSSCKIGCSGWQQPWTPGVRSSQHGHSGAGHTLQGLHVGSLKPESHLLSSPGLLQRRMEQDFGTLFLVPGVAWFCLCEIGLESGSPSVPQIV